MSKGLEQKWAKIVDRGPVLLPSFEHARGSGNLYAVDKNGNLDYREVVGTMPNTYYDKRYRDFVYYSFSAWCPVENEIGSFVYGTFDEDEGFYDDSETLVEVDPELFDVFLTYQTEEEFLKESEAE